jgi:hypothetical protein
MNRTKTGLLLWVVLYLVSGCSPSPMPRSEDLVVLSPAVIDLGNVRPTLAPMSISAVLKNNGDKPLTILDVLPDCGCTVLDPPLHPVPPKEEIQLPIKVSLYGRFGDFTHKIRIKTDAVLEDVVLTIKGKSITDIWFSGQSIRCTAEPGLSATTTVDLHTVDHPHVQFDWTNIDEDITIKELSRTTKEEETTISFSLSVDMDGNDFRMRSLTFTPLDKNITSLTIPVYCYKKEETAAALKINTQAINLGTVSSNESREVPIYGDPDLLRAIDQVSFSGIPEDVITDILPLGESKESIRIKIQFPQMQQHDSIKGELKLVTAGQREIVLPVSGGVSEQSRESVQKIIPE